MASVRDLEVAAAKSRLGFQSFGIRSVGDLAGAFSAMAKDRYDALVVVTGPFIYTERRRLIGLALKYKMPAMYGAAEYIDAGGLVSYAPSYAKMFRQAAIYVDKLLTGANPGHM